MFFLTQIMFFLTQVMFFLTQIMFFLTQITLICKIAVMMALAGSPLVCVMLSKLSKETNAIMQG